MPNETNNTTEQFSHLLRRHLHERESVECQGLDIDLATAYLEDSLLERERLDYDAHLADCPPCRRHVIELSRLVELTPGIANGQPIPDRVPLADGRNWLDAIHNALTAPFRMPAFGLVTFALLVAFVTVGVLWNRGSNSDQPVLPAGETQARLDPPAGGGSTPVEGSPALPKETIDPNPTAPVVSQSALSRGREVDSAAVRTGSAVPMSNGRSSNIALAPEPARPNLPIATSPNPQIPALNSPETALRPRSDLQLNVNNGQRNGGSSSSFQIPDFGNANGFTSPRQRPRSSSSSSGTELDAERIIHGKTFRLEGRTWVDQDFHQLMRSGGNVTLVYGDQTFQTLIADSPILADFFSLRAVTLVWKGKVYRVLPR